jgi:hypothetical protein
VSLQIDAVSRELRFPVTLSPEDFDRYVAGSGPRYSVWTNDAVVVERVSRTVISCRARQVRRPIAGLDARLRLRYERRGIVLAVLWIDRWGRIVMSGKLYEAPDGEGWLNELRGVLDEISEY